MFPSEYYSINSSWDIKAPGETHTDKTVWWFVALKGKITHHICLMADKLHIHIS